MRTVLLATALALLPTPVVRAAETDQPPESKGIRLGEQFTQRWQVGVVIRATDGLCSGIFATAPVPTDWPEQQVKIVDEEISPHVQRVAYRTLDNGVRQMLVSIPRLAPGDTAKALVTFEVTRRAILAPPDPERFVLAQRLPREVSKFLAPSPYIESRHRKIRTLAKEIVPEQGTAWQQVEAIYDWVREHVEYQEGPLKGALAALRDGDGDCEEMTSLFIALCRARRIPARTVWVPGHCYPEFYLQDEDGHGHWLPCQAAGSRDFGSMPDFRPILQKGDSFKVPEKRESQRYVAEFLRVQSVGGSGQPDVHFVRELLAAP